jgi:hypothetical protein
MGRASPCRVNDRVDCLVLRAGLFGRKPSSCTAPQNWQLWHRPRVACVAVHDLRKARFLILNQLPEDLSIYDRLLPFLYVYSTFSIFLFSAYRKRRQPDWHKRLITFALFLSLEAAIRRLEWLHRALGIGPSRHSQTFACWYRLFPTTYSRLRDCIRRRFGLRW